MNLEDLDDVVITDPQAGHTLKKVAEGWVNQPACAKDEEPGIPEPEDDGNAYLRKYDEWIKYEAPTIDPGTPSGIGEAPTDGALYGRNGLQQKWLPITNSGGGATYKAGYGLNLNGVNNEFTIDTNIVRTKDLDDGAATILDFLPANKTPDEITDWSPIFQDAVDSARRMLIVPDIGKAYQFKSTVVIKDKWGFSLVGNGQIVIKPTVDHVHSGKDSTVDVKLFLVRNCGHVSIRGLYFTGGYDEGLTGKATLCEVRRSNNVIWDDCEFYWNQGMGLTFVDNNSGNSGRGLVVTRCRFQNLGGYDPNQTTESRLAALVFSPAAGALKNIIVSESAFANIGLDGVSFGGCINVRLTDCVFTENNAGMVYSAGSKNVIIKGCVVHRSGGTGIDIANSQEVIVSNNTVYDCSSCGIGIFATESIEGTPFSWNINVSDNVCYNNHTQEKARFGENAYNGGINITANGDGAEFRRVVISGNVVFDDHNLEDVTQDWAIGCGNNRTHQNKFREIRIDESNILESYATGADLQIGQNDIQSPAVGIQPYGDSYKLASGQECQLGYIVRGFEQLNFWETKGGESAIMMIGYDRSTPKFMNANGVNNQRWAVADVAGRICVIMGPEITLNGSPAKRVYLKNNSGEDTYIWCKGKLL